MSFLAISLLASDPVNYIDFVLSLKKFENKLDIIHFDIMDGIFVENKSFGSEIVKKMRDKSVLRFDTHLMVIDPENYIKDLCEAGTDLIIFHYEASENPTKIINQIKSYNKLVGLAVNPQTNIKEILAYLNEINLLLIMTVQPGACGKEFIKSRLNSIKIANDYIKNNNLTCSIQIDGGINFETASLALEYGANSIVSGSYLVQNSSINQENLIKLKNLATQNDK